MPALSRSVQAIAAGAGLVWALDRQGSQEQRLRNWGLYREYGFTDADGTQPDWAAHWASALAETHGPLGEPL